MSLPEAPRNPRWRAALRAWWPLGLAAGAAFFILTVTGGALWAQSGGDTPFQDWTLDGAADRSEAQVTRVEPTGIFAGGARLDAVTYTFDLGDGRRRFGVSYGKPGRFRAGTRHAVEFVPAEPDVHRLAGAKRAATSYWLPSFLGWAWLPSLVVLLFWFRRVWRVRVMLRNGPAAPARVDAVHPLTGVLPPHLRARFSFTDRSGQEHRGGHWVRRSSPMGRRLQSEAVAEEVVYDELQPRSGRLAGPEDFLPS